MPLMEGIGDEVLQFASIVLLCSVILLAWWSTGYSNNERVGTIVIVERNVRRIYNLMPRLTGSRHRHRNNVTVYHLTTNPVPAIQDTGTNSPEPSTSNNINNSSVDTTSSEDVPTDTESLTDNIPDNIDNEIEQTTQDNEASQHNISPQEIEMNRIVNAMESVTCNLRNRRLAYFDGQPSENFSSDEKDNNTESPSTSTQSDESVEINEESLNETVESSMKSDEPEVANTDNIRIRLKYLNDDSKLVEGSLHEALGEFKRRHFRGEMSARNLVRLVFNGKVLHREAATLASCGLFDNCVVHCLIHQPRTPSQHVQVQQQLNPSLSTDHISLNNNQNLGNSPLSAGITEQNDREERDWDLSHILLTILASILSIAWYCHIRFSSLFGVAASVAMLGLTGLYVFAVICVYYPETANSDIQGQANNRPAQQPQNVDAN